MRREEKLLRRVEKQRFQRFIAEELDFVSGGPDMAELFLPESDTDADEFGNLKGFVV